MVLTRKVVPWSQTARNREWPSKHWRPTSENDFCVFKGGAGGIRLKLCRLRLKEVGFRFFSKSPVSLTEEEKCIFHIFPRLRFTLCVRQNQFKCLFRKKTNPQHPRLCSEEREVWSRGKSCHQISIYWFKEITWVKQWRSKKPNVCTKSSRDSLFPAKVTPINHRRNVPHYPRSFAYYFNLSWEIEASTTHKPWHVFPSPENPFLHLQA